MEHTEYLEEEEEEYDECSYCDFKIMIKDMDMDNWIYGAYYCDRCFKLIKEDENDGYDTDSD